MREITVLKILSVLASAPSRPALQEIYKQVSPSEFSGTVFFFLAQEWENKATWLISGKEKKKRTRDVGPKLGHVLHTQNSDYERTIEMESDPHCAKQYRSGTWDRVQGFLWPQGLCFLL